MHLTGSRPSAAFGIGGLAVTRRTEPCSDLRDAARADERLVHEL
jgi:hypothetical protein